jgi:hypothetical protein
MTTGQTKTTLPNTTNRVPLGGKSANIHNNNISNTIKKQNVVDPSTVVKPNSTRRTPLSRSNRKSSAQKRNQSLNLNNNYEAEEVDAFYGDWEIETIPEKPEPLPDLPLDHIELDYAEIFSRPRVYTDEDDDDEIPVSELLNNLEELDLPVTESELRQMNNKKKAAKKKVYTPTYMAPTKSVQAKQRPPLSSKSLSSSEKLEKSLNIDVTTKELESLLDF